MLLAIPLVMYEDGAGEEGRCDWFMMKMPFYNIVSKERADNVRSFHR